MAKKKSAKKVSRTKQTRAKKAKKPEESKKEPADTRRFLINSEGECFRGNVSALGGLMTMADLAERIHGDRTKVPTHKEIIDEWDRVARAKLSPPEYRLYKRLETLQQLNNGRFRIYGWLDRNYKQVVVLVTEFIWWVEDPFFWDRLGQLARKTGAKVEIMDESPHCDKSGRPDRKTGEMVWREGLNHGRMERQVELSWRLARNAKVRDVVGRMMSLAAVTAEVWPQAGVDVI